MSERDRNREPYCGSGGTHFAILRTGPLPGAAVERRRSVHATPIVTVFGAGITGLSVAHELIERGFRVRVVEQAPSEDREYECEVGGLARNQFGRAPLYAAQLAEELPWLADAPAGEPGGSDPAARARQHLRTLLAIAHEARAGAPPSPSGARPASPELAPTTARAAQTVLGMRCAGTRHPFPERLAFSYPCAPEDSKPIADTDRYGAANADKIELILDRLSSAWRDSRADIVQTLRDLGGEAAVRRFDPEGNAQHARLVLDVDLVASSSAPRDEGSARTVTAAIAEQVRQQLIAANAARAQPIPRLDDVLDAKGLGAAAPNADAPPTYLKDAAIWVELRVLERLLPGEHGYRYFPAFYRNLFEVMRRTPIVDDDGRVTHETAYDQLVASPTVGFAFRGGQDARGRPTPAALREFPRRRAQSVRELREHLQLTFEHMRVSERDLLFYELALLRYATSSPARRRGYEDVSWWDFVRGRTSADERPVRDGDELDPRNAVYSERMAHWLRELPQALIAMQSSETDARTYGTIVCQLLQGDLGDGTLHDMTLNGPTSTAWLRPWKRFLKRQGVDFYVGELTGLELDPHGGLHPQVAGPDGDRPRLEPFDRFSGTAKDWNACRTPGVRRAFDDSDFFVLAVPVEVAARLVRPLGEPRRVASAVQGPALEGDLARLAQLVRVAGIGDPAGVRREFASGRPSSARYPLRDFAGVQYFFPRRIGIGDGHVYYADAEWGLSSISQLAYWRDRGGPRGAFLGQISVDIGDWYAPRELASGERLPALRCSRAQIARATWAQIAECAGKGDGATLPTPAFYHLDRSIEWRDGVVHNATPFLISLPRQWALRPGLYGPARELMGADADEVDELENSYPEAAARRRRRAPRQEIVYRIAHRRWVLAGTYMATYTRLTTMEAANESARHAVNAILSALRHASEPDGDGAPRYNGAGQNAGDPCRIANPEDSEWPDLEPLRRLDAALVAENLPHVLDILRLPETLARVPHRPAHGGPLGELTRLAQLASEGLAQDAAPLASSLDGLTAGLEQKLRELYEKLGTGA